VVAKVRPRLAKESLGDVFGSPFFAGQLAAEESTKALPSNNHQRSVVPIDLSSDGWPMVAVKHLPGKHVQEIEEKAFPPSTYPFEDERLATERKLGKAVAAALAAIQQAVFKKLDRESRSLKELIEEYGEKFNPHHDAVGKFAKTGGGGGWGKIAPGKSASHEDVVSSLQGHKTERSVTVKGGKVVSVQFGVEHGVEHGANPDFSGTTHYHNHPLKVPPTDGDVNFLLRGKGPDKMHVVAPHGTYTLTRKKGGDHTSEFWKLSNQLRGESKYDEMYDESSKVAQDWVLKEASKRSGLFSYSFSPTGSKAVEGEKTLSDVPADQAFWDEQKAAFFEQAGPATQDALMAAAAQASSFGLAADFDLINQGVLEFTRTFGDEWWGRLEGTTREGLRAAIGANISTGAPLSNLKKSLEPLFGKTRAEMIASTETTRLYAEGNSIAYRAAGVTQLEWRTAQDERVCPICGPLHKEKFPIDGDKPPAHCRCRCWIVPVVDGKVLEAGLGDSAERRAAVDHILSKRKYDVNRWEQEQPWNLSKGDIKAGKAPGIQYGGESERSVEPWAGMVEARNMTPASGNIKVYDKYFELDKDNRRFLLEHEAAHDIQYVMGRDGSGERVLAPYRVSSGRYNAPFASSISGQGMRFEETVAYGAQDLKNIPFFEDYSNPYVRKQMPFYREAADVAHKLGMPVHDGWSGAFKKTFG